MSSSVGWGEFEASQEGLEGSLERGTSLAAPVAPGERPETGSREKPSICRGWAAVWGWILAAPHKSLICMLKRSKIRQWVSWWGSAWHWDSSG